MFLIPDDEVDITSVLDLQRDAVPGIKWRLVVQVKYFHLIHVLPHEPESGSEGSIYESLYFIEGAGGVGGLELYLVELLAQELEADVVLHTDVFSSFFVEDLFDVLIGPKET